MGADGWQDFGPILLWMNLVFETYQSYDRTHLAVFAFLEREGPEGWNFVGQTGQPT